MNNHVDAAGSEEQCTEAGAEEPVSKDQERTPGRGQRWWKSPNDCSALWHHRTQVRRNRLRAKTFQVLVGTKKQMKCVNGGIFLRFTKIFGDALDYSQWCNNLTMGTFIVTAHTMDITKSTLGI